MNYELNSDDSEYESIVNNKHYSVSHDESFKVKRSAARERFLIKMWKTREMLKWKYNYFEANPHEHRIYRQCLKRYQVYRKTFKFKKLWRLKMDELFDEETLKATKILLQKELAELNRSKSSDVTLSDPTRFLNSYDREVVIMMRRVRNKFSFYLRHPKCFPYYENEFKEFLIQLCDSNCPYYKDLSLDVNHHFGVYWERRVSLLCDLKIQQEKRTIRKNWKKLLPVYFHSGDDKASPEELKSLLLSDEEEEEGQKDFKW